jgi:hypothetical protein
MRADLTLKQLLAVRKGPDAFSPAHVAAALEQVDLGDFRRARQLAALHESLLFLRAYPSNEEVARMADGLLLAFGARLEQLQSAGADLAPLEEPEISGIAGSGVTAVFSYDVARDLFQRHGADVTIGWDAWDTVDSLARVLPHLVPLLDDDALVEPHVPWREWVRAAAGPQSELGWFFDAIARAWPSPREQTERYDSLGLPLRWSFGHSSATRTLMRLPSARFFAHDGPLLRGKAAWAHPTGAEPFAIRRLPAEVGQVALALARDTSAVRHRELHGFTFGDPRYVDEIEAGRGVVFFLSGVPPGRRLPLRAYHALTIWKNGVPVGYFEGLSLFERMEAGFNLYYTFREGETSWIYTRLLQALHELLGINCFVIDPYQIGHENDEGLRSGAYWFYRKLGFRSTSAQIRELSGREEARVRADPAYRATLGTMKKLVRAPLIYEWPGSETGDWDGFSLRRAAQAAVSHAADANVSAIARAAGLEHWPRADRALLQRVVAAKQAPEESRYLELMRHHTKLRRAFLALGAAPDGYQGSH